MKLTIQTVPKKYRNKRVYWNSEGVNSGSTVFSSSGSFEGSENYLNITPSKLVIGDVNSEGVVLCHGSDDWALSTSPAGIEVNGILGVNGAFQHKEIVSAGSSSTLLSMPLVEDGGALYVNWGGDNNVLHFKKGTTSVDGIIYVDAGSLFGSSTNALFSGIESKKGIHAVSDSYNPLIVERSNATNTNIEFKFSDTVSRYLGTTDSDADSLRWGENPNSAYNSVIFHEKNANNKDVDWTARSLKIINDTYPSLDFRVDTDTIKSSLFWNEPTGEFEHRIYSGDGTSYKSMLKLNKDEDLVTVNSELKVIGGDTFVNYLHANNRINAGTSEQTSFEVLRLNSASYTYMSFFSKGVRKGYIQVGASNALGIYSDNGEVALYRQGKSSIVTMLRGVFVFGNEVDSYAEIRLQTRQTKDDGTEDIFNNGLIRTGPGGTMDFYVYGAKGAPATSNITIKNAGETYIRFGFSTKLYTTNTGVITNGLLSVNKDGSWGYYGIADSHRFQWNGTDLVLGNDTSGDGGRALVHSTGNKLTINYAGDFSAVEVESVFKTKIGNTVKFSVEDSFTRFYNIGYFSSDFSPSILLNRTNHNNGGTNILFQSDGENTAIISSTPSAFKIIQYERLADSSYLNFTPIEVLNNGNIFFRYGNDEKIKIGDDATTFSSNLKNNGYTGGAGFTGAGWSVSVDESGDSTIFTDNLVVRKKQSVYELEINKIRATNGALWVSDSMKVGSVATGDDGEYFAYCYMAENDEDKNVPFEIGDIVRVQRWDRKHNSLINSTYTVYGGVEDSEPFVAIRRISGNHDVVENDVLVRIGNTGDTDRQGSIYLTSSDSGAPYLDVLDGVNSESFSEKTKLRIGKLDGLNQSGYGIWGGVNGEKVFHISSDGTASIAGWSFDKDKLYSKDSKIELNSDGSITTSSGLFKVDTTGKLTATGADISGKITVTEGSNVKVANSTTVDLLNLDENTYYPIIVYLPNSQEIVTLEVRRPLNSSYGLPSYSTHSGGFSTIAKWETNASGWGTNIVKRNIISVTEKFVVDGEVSFGTIDQMLNSSNEYIYLRGGSKYDVIVTSSKELTPILITEPYTYKGQTIAPISSVTPITKDQITAGKTVNDLTTFSSISNKEMKITSGSDFVRMFYDSANSFGLESYKGTSKVFSVGSSNVIAGWNITENFISSGNLGLFSSGHISCSDENYNYWSLNSNGSGYFAKGAISWNSDGVLTVKRVTATQGTIGGFEINSNFLKSIPSTNETLLFMKLNADSGALTFHKINSSGVEIPYTGMYSSVLDSWFHVGLLPNTEGWYTETFSMLGGLDFLLETEGNIDIGSRKTLSIFGDDGIEIKSTLTTQNTTVDGTLKVEERATFKSVTFLYSPTFDDTLKIEQGNNYFKVYPDVGETYLAESKGPWLHNDFQLTSEVILELGGATSTDYNLVGGSSKPSVIVSAGKHTDTTYNVRFTSTTEASNYTVKSTTVITSSSSSARIVNVVRSGQYILFYLKDNNNNSVTIGSNKLVVTLCKKTI